MVISFAEMQKAEEEKLCELGEKSVTQSNLSKKCLCGIHVNKQLDI